MAKYEVTAYLSGHDHCLNHIEEDGIYFVLSGAGAKAWYTADNMGKIETAKVKWYWAKGNKGDFDGGFASVTLTDEAATVRYYGNDGTELYTATPKPPRSGRQVVVSV